MSDKEYGLNEDWVHILATLERVIPVYDKTNRYISLGTDLKVRKLGIDLFRTSQTSLMEANILDLGAGPGMMTTLLEQSSIMVDGLMPMLKVAKKRNIGSHCLVGVFENLPFRENSIDGAISGFAIRDARNLMTALAEINFVLKCGANFLIVDLSKPDSAMKRKLVAIYWRLFAPLLAVVASGRLGLKFVALSRTYSRLPGNSEFEKLTKMAGFLQVSSTHYMLDGVTILLLKKVAI